MNAQVHRFETSKGRVVTPAIRGQLPTKIVPSKKLYRREKLRIQDVLRATARVLSQ